MSAWDAGRPILTAGETRAAEQALFDGGMSVEALMARAGAALAELVWRHAGPVDTLIVCGPGNNGGDGYVAAALLRRLGMTVRVAALAAPRTDAARHARDGWGGAVEAFAESAPATVLVDALFGTGLTRGLDTAVATKLAALAAAATVTIAVDLPSGIATDDGAVLTEGLPRFDLTLALGALKPAHRLRPAADHVGRVVVGEIGIPTDATGLRELARPRLSAPTAADHKYSRGMVAVAGGAMPGAALLAATAAQRAGAGYVALSNGAGGGPMALVHRPLEALIDDKRVGALAIGPGLGRDSAARDILAVALGSARPLLVDADALVLLGQPGLKRLGALEAMAILTPHEGEFAKLFPGIASDRLSRARAGAARSGAVLLLKGSDSIVAHPDGRAVIAPAAPAWLASAGTGDVLAGTIAAMRARGLDAFDAACAGLWLHGEAARIAGPALIADDLAAALPRALEQCL
ncbi:bifunctional ADP-dependent NAD(P)H-hydrate dehydratase/NAD(P)H-hydrate epimerase [Sphingomonas sanxanigenens]|uniref:Bifunctional NAD(P)H-hydrate repair enzyme n=1 Tax=Sphingomonas sanxanigenens DSM 19645 = NX02 TaxID=1123269 RepID=W0AEX1_9SPHN|nr:bifunctional ADP-dependent NAD(P)H-hydrate dehydratase/NAD(P)H-hydrate epimerase [Sphingomonas sanxanigenens]AHE55062.1 hypothetical protein NX02_16920 [Sphingomonas sanxanigenens DSM 19645 = NX02]